MVRKSVMFSNVIVDIAFPRRSFVSSPSSCEVSASLTDVGGVAVGAIDVICCSRYPPLSPPIEFAPSSSPLPYTVFAPTLFEFDPIKSSSPLD